MSAAAFLDNMRCLGVIAAILVVVWLSNRVWGGGE